METKKNRPVGSIKVSDSVILKIAEVAATEIEGVDSNGQELTPANAKAKMFGAVKTKLTGESVAIAQVAGTPGSGFGKCGEGYFRLTAFNTRENTIEAMERIKKNIEKITQ